jgi:putative transposase
VVNNLNTHCSESLVRYVPEACGITEDLGIKEKRGILKSMATRAAWLTDQSHKIVFHHTPKHVSWMNQVEALAEYFAAQAVSARQLHLHR